MSDDLDKIVEDLHEEIDEEISQLKEKIDKLEDKKEKISERVEQVNEVQNSRLDAVNEYIDDIETELSDARLDLEDSYSDLEKRVAAIESELGLDDWDSEVLAQGVCALERLTLIPRERREEKLNVNLYRASIIWERFEDWSETVKSGRIIKSTNLLKLLSAELNSDLKYSQLYRAMEEFNKNSPDYYEYKNPDNKEKFLLRTFND